MNEVDLERNALDFELTLAQQRANALQAGSPSWDAAMSMVDELRKAAARLDARAAGQPIMTRIPESVR